MKVYDYSHQKDLVNDIFTEIEQMSQSEMEEMLAMADTVRRKNAAQVLRQKEKWYENVLLPALKEFAENEGLLLEVEKEGDSYTATMRSDYSIEILRSCTGMRMALQLSECIEIRQEEKCCLTLIHNCETLPAWPLEEDEEGEEGEEEGEEKGEEEDGKEHIGENGPN